MVDGIPDILYCHHLAVIQLSVIPGGESFTRFELIKNKVHPSLPLHVFTFRVPIFQFGPNIIEILIQLLQQYRQLIIAPGQTWSHLRGLSSPVYRDGEEAQEEEGHHHEDVVETGVWNGGGFATTKSGLIGPVQSTVGVGVAALTAGGDAGERSAEPGEN